MDLLTADDDAKNPTAASELPPAEEEGEEQERTVEEGPPEEPLEDPGAGYDGPKGSDEERRRMFDDPKLRGEVRRAVARKVPASDVDDVAQNAMVSAFRAPGLPAGDGPDRDRYVMGTARNEVKMYWRGRKTQKDIKDTIKIGRVVQAVELDRLEVRDMFARVKLPGGRWDDFTCLMRHKLQKVPLVTLAAERGEEYETFAKRMARLEKTIRVQMSGLGAVTAMVLGLFLILRNPKPADMAFDLPGPVAAPESAVSTQPTESDPVDQAGALRGQAYRACLDFDWRTCQSLLDVAAQIDPSGDRDPIVQAARSDASTGIASQLKPGSTWRPQGVRPYAPYASR